MKICGCLIIKGSSWCSVHLGTLVKYNNQEYWKCGSATHRHLLIYTPDLDEAITIAKTHPASLLFLGTYTCKDRIFTVDTMPLFSILCSNRHRRLLRELGFDQI